MREAIDKVIRVLWRHIFKFTFVSMDGYWQNDKTIQFNMILGFYGED